MHRISVRLQPSNPLVRKALIACRSVLHPAFAEKMLAGWWHVVQWRREQKPPAVDLEWSSFVILLFASFLALGNHKNPTSEEDRDTPSRRRDANWRAMQAHDIPNGSAYSPWASKNGWRWVLEEGIPGCLQGGPNRFVQEQIELAKKCMSSSVGQQAFGLEGFMPTAPSRDDKTRKSAASNIVLALHLLLEEQKLDIMCPEDVSPSQTDLRVVLWQIVRWLGWAGFEAVYELGMQPDLDHRHDSGK